MKKWTDHQRALTKSNTVDQARNVRAEGEEKCRPHGRKREKKTVATNAPLSTYTNTGTAPFTLSISTKQQLMRDEESLETNLAAALKGVVSGGGDPVEHPSKHLHAAGLEKAGVEVVTVHGVPDARLSDQKNGRPEGGGDVPVGHSADRSHGGVAHAVDHNDL